MLPDTCSQSELRTQSETWRWRFSDALRSPCYCLCCRRFIQFSARWPRRLRSGGCPARFLRRSLLLGTTGEFAAALNNWFDDRVGFRDLFIRTKNQIDYTFFRTSKKVYIGSNGWLFLRGEGHAIEQLNDDGLSALEESYVKLAERLREKGIRLIVVGYPSKLAIYPEMAPAELRAASHNDNYDKFRRFLANRADLISSMPKRY